MAYNVLKGNVQFINSDSGSIESMVDNYSDQTIAGIKTFSSAITASMGLSSSVAIEARSFTGAGDGITGVNAASILITGDANNRVLTAKGDGTLQAEQNFTFDSANNLLTVAGDITASINISGSEFYGKASGLTNIPTNQFVGTISAADLTLGNGVENDSNNLAIKLSASSGLSLTSNGLGVSPNNAISIVGGLASADEFLVADNNLSNALRKATVTNLQTYMQDNLNFGGAAGSQHQIQFRDGAGSFAASSDLTFNDSTDILNVTGKITASVHISSSQVFATSLHGDGGNLTNLPAAELVGNVNASNINIGDGLFNQSNKLSVSASFGLTASAGGLEVTASNTSGLNVTPATGLTISPIRTPAKATPVAADIILLGDSADFNNVKNATLTSVVTLVQNNGAAGSNTQVQFNSSNAFAGDNAFTFNAATNTLAVQEVSSSGNISASFFYGDGSNLQNVGGQSSYNSFTSNFNVFVEQDIIGVVTTGSAITASLPSAATYAPGQRVTFKDVSGSCSGSNHIVISASAYGSGDRIDGQGIVKIKTGFGAVTIASDGVGSFYIVSTS